MLLLQRLVLALICGAFAAAAPLAAVAQVTANAQEEFAWSLVKDTSDVEKLEGFIATFPDSIHFDEAIARMRILLPAVETGVTIIASVPPEAIEPLPNVPTPKDPAAALIDACAREAAWPSEAGFEEIGRQGREIDAKAAIAACEAAVAAAPDSEEAKAWLARALLRTGREDDALPLLEAAVGAGSIPATFLLGYTLRDNGKDALPRSADLLGRAAEAGFVPAFIPYGVALELGLGVPVDQVAALDYYRRADAAGVAEGATNVGVAYASGIGIEEDPKEAVAWFQKGADAGSSRAFYLLGESYRVGYGVARDNARAAGFYEKGAELGELQSKRMLGYLYAEGLGVKRDRTKAFELTLAAAEGGDTTAMGSLVHFYNVGLGVKKDLDEALLWAERGAALGNRSAQANLAAMYESGKGVKRDLAKARELYELAAAQGLEQAVKALERLGFDPVLVTAIQEELDRAGCNPGAADGDWGPGSRRALEAFGKGAGIDLAGSVPSKALLAMLQAETEAVCTP